MDQPQLPPTMPFAPPPPRQRGALFWVVLGLGALVLLLVLAFASVLVLLPDARNRALALVGIAGNAPPPESPKNPNPPTIARPLVIDETFDQPTERWDQSGARVVDGSYELRVDIPYYDGYGLYIGPANDTTYNASAIDNFDLAVDAQQTAGDPLAEYGIRFRQSGPGDYLIFSISGTGHYRLARVTNETYSSVVPWTFSNRIRTGQGASNRLRVVAENADITAFINDTQVFKTRDEVNAAGQLTLGLATYNKGGLTVRFSNMAGKAGTADLGENFADPAKVRWSVGGSQIAGGGYEIEAGTGVQTWQQPLPTGSSKVANCSIEVDAELIDGAGGAAYGVLFGDNGKFEYYSLFIFPEGAVGLFRRKDGETTPIVPITPISVVKRGTGAVNTLKIDIKGTTISVTLNGELLGEVESDGAIEGMVGMTVVGGSEGTTRAKFGKFVLKEAP